MENASKALIIAAAILIAIMILSMSVFIFSKIGNKARDFANMDEQEIASFNSKITPYLGGAVSGTKVNALLQYCLSNNMTAKKNGETDKYITVKYITVKNINTIIINGNSQSYERVVTGGKTYEVKGDYDENSLMTSITIKELL